MPLLLRLQFIVFLMLTPFIFASLLPASGNVRPGIGQAVRSGKKGMKLEGPSKEWPAANRLGALRISISIRALPVSCFSFPL